jgi:hypothetical protein
MPHIMFVPFALALALSVSAAPASKKTQLKIEVKPAAAVVYVNGKRLGTGARTLRVKEPGRHTIRVVHKKDEHQEVVFLKKGEAKVWSWAFEDDRPAGKGPTASAEGEAADGEQKDAPPAEEKKDDWVSDPDMK